jgi:hypothetical protein
MWQSPVVLQYNRFIPQRQQILSANRWAPCISNLFGILGSIKQCHIYMSNLMTAAGNRQVGTWITASKSCRHTGRFLREMPTYSIPFQVAALDWGMVGAGIRVVCPLPEEWGGPPVGRWLGSYRTSQFLRIKKHSPCLRMNWRIESKNRPCMRSWEHIMM